MASGDYPSPQHRTFSKSRVPLIGALVDYIDTSIEYLWTKTFTNADNMFSQTSMQTISIRFTVLVCLLLGLVTNVKLEVVTLDEKALPDDLHIVLLSNKYKLYVDDIDVSKILCCIEASDALLIIICCILISNSAFVSSPMSEYIYLPWLGASLRGLIFRQAPTFGGVLYTMYVMNKEINTMLLTTFTFLFLIELQLWLQVAKYIAIRLNVNKLKHTAIDHEVNNNLLNNDEVPSIEVRNYVY